MKDALTRGRVVAALVATGLVIGLTGCSQTASQRVSEGWLARSARPSMPSEFHRDLLLRGGVEESQAGLTRNDHTQGRPGSGGQVLHEGAYVDYLDYQYSHSGRVYDDLRVRTRVYRRFSK